MFWFIAVLGLLPLGFLLRLKLCGGSWTEAGALGVLTAVALGVASPFITSRSLGTGEYYNYSLAVADSVTQLREGVFPVFVGQSEYAFNGRVHPLRTAVYFTHAAGLLDLLTFRQLSFWALQNLSLALSLVAAAFSMFAALRALERVSVWVATALAVFYVLSPGLLAPAYSMDLYMTVTAAPFLPIALLGAWRSWRDRRLRDYVIMAIGLAGAWLAHPPVAAWTTLGCGIVVLGSWLTHRPRWSAAGALAGGAVVGLVLGGWSFASALSLPDSLVEAGAGSLLVKAITSVTTSSGWVGLWPVSRDGMALGDFQLGYTGYLLLALTLWTAIRTRRGDLAALVGAAGLFLVLTLPVPVLHQRAWSLMPAVFGMLTNVWPMQRAYLVTAVFVAFGFAAAWPWLATQAGGSRGKKSAAAVTVVIALLWTGAQAWPFLARGWSTRVPAAESVRNYQPTNLAYSIVTYAFTGTPDNYSNGPRDPEQELRLLAADGQHELLSNARAGRGPGPVVQGKFHALQPSGSVTVQLAPNLTLQPGKKYRLTFGFLPPPLEGVIHLSGDATVSRDYVLPHSEGRRGFGMTADNSHAITLWSDAPTPETVTLSLHLPHPVREWQDFASFTLEEIAPAQLPIKLGRLSPSLTCTVDAPAAGWLETPRMAVRGYEATVDGQRVYPRRAHDGRVLVPVPAGRHAVELTYRAPALLRVAAGTSLAGWAVVLLALMLPGAATARAAGILRTARPSPRVGWALAACAAGIGVVVFVRWWPEQAGGVPRSPGPVRLRLALPIDAVGQAEPLVSAGAGLDSTTVYVRYVSSDRICLGISGVGGHVDESEELPIDFAAPIDVVVTSGMLYHRGEERLRGLLGSQAEWLLTHTRVTLNGREVVHATRAQLPAKGSRINLAPRVTPTTSYLRPFSGEVLERRWLPLDAARIPWPTDAALRRDAGPLRIVARLPKDRAGQCEPLATCGAGDGAFCAFVHYVDNAHVRVGVEGRGTGPIFSEPFPFDYNQPLDVVVSHPSLYPAGNPQLKDYSPAQFAKLRDRVRLAVGDRWLVTAPVPAAATAAAGAILFDRNGNGAGYPSPGFNGEILRVQRVPRDGWPIPPGNPEAATAPGAAGPLEFTVQLPAGLTGRSQPLLTIGRPGKGAFVIVKFVDPEHVQVGMDVWNKALLWSKPLAVDYARPHKFVVSISALFPLDAPAVRALPAAAAQKLRNEIRLALDGDEVLHESLFTYDSAPADITPGVSHIGGSYTEAVFTGEILALRRLPLSAP